MELINQQIHLLSFLSCIIMGTHLHILLPTVCTIFIRLDTILRFTKNSLRGYKKFRDDIM